MTTVEFQFQDRPIRQVLIEFDGGTSCNIPRLGYGIGYGSFRIDEGEVHRVDHGAPMSANAAEVLTLVAAVRAVAMFHTPEETRLLIIGDSQIALKWAEGRTPRGKKAKLSKGSSEEFRAAIDELRQALQGFAHVGTQWKRRDHSVAIFGH